MDQEADMVEIDRDSEDADDDAIEESSEIENIDAAPKTDIPDVKPTHQTDRKASVVSAEEASYRYAGRTDGTDNGTDNDQFNRKMSELGEIERFIDIPNTPLIASVAPSRRATKENLFTSEAVRNLLSAAQGNSANLLYSLLSRQLKKERNRYLTQIQLQQQEQHLLQEKLHNEVNEYQHKLDIQLQLQRQLELELNPNGTEEEEINTKDKIGNDVQNSQNGEIRQNDQLNINGFSTSNVMCSADDLEEKIIPPTYENHPFKIYLNSCDENGNNAIMYISQNDNEKLSQKMLSIFLLAGEPETLSDTEYFENNISKFLKVTRRGSVNSRRGSVNRSRRSSTSGYKRKKKKSGIVDENGNVIENENGSESESGEETDSEDEDDDDDDEKDDNTKNDENNKIIDDKDKEKNKDNSKEIEKTDTKSNEKQAKSNKKGIIDKKKIEIAPIIIRSQEIPYKLIMINLNHKNIENESVLTLAIKSNNLNVCRYLIERGALISENDLVSVIIYFVLLIFIIILIIMIIIIIIIIIILIHPSTICIVRVSLHINFFLIFCCCILLLMNLLLSLLFLSLLLLSL